MPKGMLYTKEEDDALLAILQDFPKAKFTENAQRAQKYGLCTNRNLNGLSQHLSILAKPPVKESESVEDFDLEKAQLNNEVVRLKARLRVLLDAIIGKATLFDKNNSHYLKLDYQEINRVIYTEFPTEVAAKLEELFASEEVNNE